MFCFFFSTTNCGHTLYFLTGLVITVEAVVDVFAEYESHPPEGDAVQPLSEVRVRL